MNYGRYEIRRELGRGSMGVVYLAHDPQIDRLVALKVLREDRLTSEDLLQRFMKEARAIGRLSPHPHIVTVFDVGQDHGTVYIAMEFLEGEPLSDVLRARRLSAAEIVDLGVQVAETLDYAHRKGIVHRDIKPSNIIITAQGQVKITDFGIARIEDPAEHQQTQAGEILGTPVYMSPEQVMGQKVDGRSDLYSLAVILYELAVGTRPFKGENLATVFRAITQDAPPDPAKADPSVPKALATVILKGLDKRTEERFQTGGEMSRSLKSCLQGSAPPVTPAHPSHPSPKRGRRMLLLLLAVLAAAALAGGLVHLLRTPAVLKKITSGSPGSQALGPPHAKKEQSALLKIDSLPMGAQVFVDQTFKGETPLAITLPIGDHEVRVGKADYFEWEARVTLVKDRETPLFVRLIPKDEKKP